MWDRLLTGCHVATMDPDHGAPFGLVEDAAIGIQDGRVVRVGRRVELAGLRAARVDMLNGALVTPGLVDCHTHLVFAGDRAREFERRLEGASYEEIAREGGGIRSTVAAVREAGEEELVEQSRPRLHALMAGGVTTVEIKSGYGLDVANELKMLHAAKALGESESVRVVPTLLALHALPPGYEDSRADYVRLAAEEMVPAATGLAHAVDAFCEHIGFARDEVEELFRAAAAHGLRVKLHAEQLSDQKGAALAARYGALSADHLEYAGDEAIAAMAKAGMVAVLLPGAFYALGETRKPPVEKLRAAGVPMAVATDCNPGTSPMLSPTLAMNMGCALFGLTPAEALAGMTREAARALGLGEEIGTIATGKAADLCVWRVDSPAELAYWIGHPGPERRIVAGEDA
ncbi:MAG: imidazolonepropionase [Sphingomonadaceae bacterium]